MSIIGGVGGGLFELLRGVRTEAAAALKGATTNSSTNTSNSSASQAIPGGHHGHGHHGGLFQQIASAVTSALQSAQGSGTTDADTAIKNAITKILTQLSSPNGASASGTQSLAGNDPDGDGDTDAPGQADSDAGAAITSFLQTLQSAGVTPQQFRQDFLAAVQSLNGGQADASGSSQLLPVGSLLNALA